MDDAQLAVAEIEHDGGLALAQPLPLDRNPAAVYLAGLSESGRRTMRHALGLLAGLLTGQGDPLAVAWGAVRFSHAVALRTALQEAGYKPATVNKALCALRGTLRAAWLLGQVTAEDYHKAAAVRGVSGSTLPAGRELTPAEIAALLGDCERDPSPVGARDAALIAVLYAAGLRRAEAVALDLADYDPDVTRLVIRGKRGKERLAYLEPGAAAALADWLAVRGDGPGPLFCAVGKGGRLTGQRLTTQAIYVILQKRGRRAGVASFSPHDLRRSFVSHLLEAGGDLAQVAALAGHSNPKTTARYDRRGEESKRRTAGLLHVPYRGRRAGGDWKYTQKW